MTFLNIPIGGQTPRPRPASRRARAGYSLPPNRDASRSASVSSVSSVSSRHPAHPPHQGVQAAPWRATAASVESLDKTIDGTRPANRHVQFIAIGASAPACSSVPASPLRLPPEHILYIAVGAIMFLLMRAIGEMMYRDPASTPSSTSSTLSRPWLGNLPAGRTASSCSSA